MRSAFLKIILPILLVILAVGAFRVMIKMRPHPETEERPVARPVITAHKVELDGHDVRVQGFGSVTAKRTVNLVPQVSGEVLEKSPDFEPGGYCQADQVLLRLDDTDYVLAAAQARANVAQAEYSLALAEEEAEVALQEWENIHGADRANEPSALVLHEPQLKLARANLDAARAALRQAEVNLSRCTISAPFDGRILTADVDAGQYLRAGTAVGSVYATDVAEITVSVPDDDLAWITIDGDETGSSEQTRVEIFAQFAGARHRWQGRAVRLGGAVDSRSRLVPVVVEIENPYEVSGNRPPLVEGMFVEVVFHGDAPQGAVTVPRTALRAGNRVWVITQERTIEIREVGVARAGIEEAVITAGLQPGELVCTSNLQVVTNGLPIRIEGEKLPASGQDKDQEQVAAAKDGE